MPTMTELITAILIALGLVMVLVGMLASTVWFATLGGIFAVAGAGLEIRRRRQGLAGRDDGADW